MISPASRRDFLKQSGALIVSFSAASVASDFGFATGAAAQGINGNPATGLDSWLAIAADGRVTAYTGKCELGHGLFTAQTQLIAEELSVPLDQVTLIQCDTALTPDQGTTSGAQSHPANFNNANLALAGATAREALVRLAATRLGVAVDQLSAKDGVISAVADPTKRVSYGELVGGKTFDLRLDPNAKRKPPSTWTVLGTPVKRLDIPALATGRFEFVHNVRVPGMLHGRVVRPPSVGANLLSVDESSVRGMPGLVKVVVKKSFVGVVAEKPWQAVQAAARLKAAWSPGTGLPPQRTFHDHMRRSPSRDAFTVNSGDVDGKLAAAARVVRATYLYPYQMHASIGTACAVADVQGEKVTVWSASQAVHPLRATMAMMLGVPPAGVRIVFRMGAGCYGVNGADTVSYDAALMAQAVGKPVRVQLARQDEMAWENYGLAFVIDQRVALDADGTITAWDYEGWSPSRGGRPGANAPGNVVTGFLAGFAPQGVTPRTPAPPPQGGFENGSNTAPSYVTGCVGPECGGCGVVKSERVLNRTVDSFHPLGVEVPEEGVVGIDGVVRRFQRSERRVAAPGGDRGGHAVGVAGDDQAVKVLRRPVVVGEFGGEEVEELGVRRRLAVAAEVERGRHDCAAEVAQPDVVGGDARGERIFRRRDPFRQCRAAAGGLLRIDGSQRRVLVALGGGRDACV
jgi:CO/xanthine dehydrogenase Mo-binding subunit